MAAAIWAVPLGVLLAAVMILPNGNEVGERLVRATLFVALGAGRLAAVRRTVERQGVRRQAIMDTVRTDYDQQMDRYAFLMIK